MGLLASIQARKHGGWPVDVEALRTQFAQGDPYSVGIEEEVMVLEHGTLGLVDRAAEVLALLGDDSRFKPELPASQLEIMTRPHPSVDEAALELLDGRRTLAAKAGSTARFATAGIHPFSPGVGSISSGPRYRGLAEQYRCVARRELVSALQVHVSVGDPDRALAVYNGARSYLPQLAALAANAPFFEGRDSGLASVRPMIATLLPRQGVPPAIDSFADYARMLAWGASSGAFSDHASWWWELRLHPGFGTLEFRVPDAQTTLTAVAAVAAVIQALVAWLGARHDAGERVTSHPTWMIAENRWLACRDGVEGELVDLTNGVRRRTRQLLEGLLSELSAYAHPLRADLDGAVRMLDSNGAMAQRAVAREEGVHAVARWLAERFLDPLGG
jgi:carboxylate-amine ligase